MATLSAVGLLLHRERDALSALAVSAVAIVAFSPFSLYSVSFQLSFWVTLGILLCTSPLTRMLEQLRPVAFPAGQGGEALVEAAGRLRHRRRLDCRDRLFAAADALLFSVGGGVERAVGGAGAVGGVPAG